MRDNIREAHQALVKEKIRDEVTLIASGGIALPNIWRRQSFAGQIW